MKAHEILQAAAGHLKDRAATYDKPEGERSMGATVEAFNAVTGHNLTETQGWLFMALLKAVRSQQGAYKADSYEDGAAYFALAGESASASIMASKPSWEDAPDWAQYLSQDADGSWCWFEIEPKKSKDLWERSDGNYYVFNSIRGRTYNPNWRDTLEQRPATDDWIPWHGGECPVGGDVTVWVRLRNGSIHAGCRSDYLLWGHSSTDSAADIIAYKVVK